MAEQGRRSQTIRAEVEKGSQQQDKFTRLDKEVEQAMAWLAPILPPDVQAGQFAAILLGELHGNVDLAVAAILNTPSFMAAVADCARLGLLPGDGYALIPLGVKDGHPKEGKSPEVLGITEYTGELQRIFNTGLVRAVVARVVFALDDFAEGEHPHDPPRFHRHGGRFSADADRGGDGKPHSAEGGFAYAVFNDGSTSDVIYMGKDEVMWHRDVARTKEVWDGKFWKSMWLKTFVHELSKWLPKSAASLRERARASSALAASPAATMPLSPTADLDQLPTPPASRRRAIGNGGNEPQQPARRKGRGPAREERQGSADSTDLRVLTGLFDQLEIPNSGTLRADYVTDILGADTPELRSGQLSKTETAKVRHALETALSQASEQNRAPREVLDERTGRAPAASADQG